MSLVLLLALLSGGTRLRAEQPRGPTDDTVQAETAKQAESDYELYKIFADTLDQIERNYVKDVSRRELMEAAIKGALEKLDPYSNYINPDEISRFRTSVEHQFGGIGIQIGMEDGQLKVISPLLGTPAYRAGLESGDAILEIDGKSTEGIQIDEAVKLLKGEPDTKVALTVRHAGEREKSTVSVTREIVHVDTVLGDTRNSDDTWDFMLDHDRHIGYIRITAFGRDTATDVKKAVEELQKEGLKGLIIDLRFNPGGLLSAAIEVSDLFIAEGKIVSTKGRNTPERTWEAAKDGTYEGFPMVVLVNHYSASASEIFSAALQDHHRAVVIGERTWGKGSVQNVIELEEGKSALKLTTAGYHRPSGKNIHRYPDAKDSDEWGVMPDKGYEVKMNGSQTARLIEYRRRRDILIGKHEKALASGDGPKKDGEDKPAADDETPTVGDPEGAATEGKPTVESDATPAAPEEKNSAGDSPNAAEKSETKEDAVPVDLSTSLSKVDPQLQKAVDYLSTELARGPEQSTQ
jgi:carboxyl-terminal processing protease